MFIKHFPHLFEFAICICIGQVEIWCRSSRDSVLECHENTQKKFNVKIKIFFFAILFVRFHNISTSNDHYQRRHRIDIIK